MREAPQSEFDFSGRVWKLPDTRTKNGRDHLVPLSDDVLAILAALQKMPSKRGWLFTLDGEAPTSNLTKRKRKLDDLMLEELRKIDPNITELAPRGCMTFAIR